MYLVSAQIQSKKKNFKMYHLFSIGEVVESVLEMNKIDWKNTPKTGHVVIPGR